MSARPPLLAVVPEAIPVELIEYAHWVVWRLENRKGKWTKPPIDAKTGGPGSHADRSTWADYECALAAYRHGGFDGLGFVLADDPHAAVDIDHCIVDGVVEPWAQRIVHDVDSYTEVSPSGSGLRIILRGALPPGRRRRARLEMYDTLRFVTLTGHRVNDRGVEDRQDAIAAVHAREFPAEPVAEGAPAAPPKPVSLDDRELLRRALRAKNGAKLAALWSGSAAAYGGDRSAADLALCMYLAFWCGNEAHRIDALFRHSCLMREKWDSRRGATTYGQITVQRAIASTREVYGAPR